MELYLIRHTEAVPLGAEGITQDQDRPLTPKGIELAHVIADAFQRHKFRVAAVLSSPLLRARQTAEEMVRSWPVPAPDIQVCDFLSPGGKRRKLARALAELSTDSIALVGHEPDLSRLTAWLIGSRKARIKLAKGGVANLRCEGEPGKGTCSLMWLSTPEWMSRGVSG